MTRLDGKMASIPDEFVCPITQTLMRDPVLTKEGHSFERWAILEWIYTNGTCPLTRRPLLSRSELIPNTLLKIRIGTWCMVQNIWDLDEDDQESMLAYYSASDSAEQLFKIKMTIAMAKQ